MTNTLPWHSTLSTDRPFYHDDTRYLEGAAITVKHRRPGHGGGDPCPHCAGFLIDTLEAPLRKSTDP